MNFDQIRRIIQTKHTLRSDEWKGAVLFLCSDEYVFFIKRSEKMPTHGGQIAFVGGHKKDDESDPWESAQREFEEETGINRKALEFIGYLPVVMTSRMQPIVPVMAKVLLSRDELLSLVRSNGEWDDFMAYPWAELVKEESWEFAWRNGYAKGPILFHPMQRGTFKPVSKDFHTHLLWGATASMVWDFLRLYYKVKDS